MKTYLLLPAIAALSACTIHYNANRYDAKVPMSGEVCIINNPEVRREFTDALIPLLTKRNLVTRILSPDAPKTSCPFVLVYTANWHWDLVTYMREARIDIYRNGKEFADANYLAPHGLVNMSTEAYEETSLKIEKMLTRMGI
jgi:hypothetical protein